MFKKRALITGIAGQDGSYLAELLLDKNYEIHGIITNEQKIDPSRLWRIKSIEGRVVLHVCDIVDADQIKTAFIEVMPDEIYHLASNVEPKVIFEDEVNTFNINFFGTINLLRAIKQYKSSCRLYCAGSSLMFGDVRESPQNECTQMNPSTPYGIAKVAGYHFVRMYREAYAIFACTGILFNHESPRRDEIFLPKKITKAVAQIKLGRQKKLMLGDVGLRRDWSFAGDVVKSMWLMLQKNEPQDYVIGSGELHSIQELLEIAFGCVDLDWRDFVVTDEKFIRKVEYANLCADSKKARDELNWRPEVGFSELIKRMVQSDLKLAENTYD